MECVAPSHHSLHTYKRHCSDLFLLRNHYVLARVFRNAPQQNLGHVSKHFCSLLCHTCRLWLLAHVVGSHAAGKGSLMVGCAGVSDCQQAGDRVFIALGSCGPHSHWHWRLASNVVAYSHWRASQLFLGSQGWEAVFWLSKLYQITCTLSRVVNDFN
jgi:hypothetical protein